MTDDLTDHVPITMMGSKVVGVIRFDPETGDITGKLTNPDLVTLLNETFGKGLMEVSFNGKPRIYVPEAKKNIDEFIKRLYSSDRVNP